jgi:hypothetical protein
MDIHTFIDTNKDKYSKWLQSMFPHAYPVVCDTSSDILASYLIANFTNNNIKFVQGTFDNKYHYWMEIDSEILDFTIVQFISDYDVSKVFIDDMYYSSYTRVKEYEPSFIDSKYINDFDKYLDNLN